MLNRLLFLAVTWLGVAANVGDLRAAVAAGLEVQLYPLSGDVRLFNSNPTPFGFVYYELNSAASSFSGAPAAWTSIADTYDAHTIDPGGTGFVDPVNDWIELSGTASKIAEGTFIGSGSLPALRSIGLGNVWNPNAVMPNDVTATIVDASLQMSSVPIVVSLLGDYNHDLTVDASDYAIWREDFGTFTTARADGNFDGVVDSADYTVWRDHFGQSLAGAGVGSLAGLSGGGASGGSLSVSIVPEPASALLALVAGGAFLSSRRWRHKRVSV